MAAPARNTPLASALLRELKEPGLDVDATFRRVRADVVRATNGEQTPELAGSRVGEYDPSGQNETDCAGMGSRWRKRRRRGVAGVHLARYPSTRVFAPEAATRLSALEAGAPSSAVSAAFAAKILVAVADALKAEIVQPATAGRRPPAAQSEAPQTSLPLVATTPTPVPTLAAAAQTADVSQVRAELRRIGCYSGGDADWSAAEMRDGVARYAGYANLGPPPAAPTAALSPLRI